MKTIYLTFVGDVSYNNEHQWFISVIESKKNKKIITREMRHKIVVRRYPHPGTGVIDL